MRKIKRYVMHLLKGIRACLPSGEKLNLEKEKHDLILNRYRKYHLIILYIRINTLPKLL